MALLIQLVHRADLGGEHGGVGRGEVAEPVLAHVGGRLAATRHLPFQQRNEGGVAVQFVPLSDDS